MDFELTTTTMQKKILVLYINRHLSGNDSSMFPSNQNREMEREENTKPLYATQIRCVPGSLVLSTARSLCHHPPHRTGGTNKSKSKRGGRKKYSQTRNDMNGGQIKNLQCRGDLAED